MLILILRFIIFLVLFFPILALAVMPMVSAGGNHTLALKSDGTVVAWGRDDYGQLGIPMDECTQYFCPKGLLPIVVPGLNNIVAVSAGENHSLALKSDGTVMAWGLNNYGQLGDGTSENQYSPVRVPGLSKIVAVSAGSQHTVALKSNGTVVAWGNNDSGQLGDGTRISRYNPVAVSGLKGVVAVSAGGRGGDLSHTVALKANGKVVVWGSHASGQLGLGYNKYVVFGSLRPLTVPRLSGVKKVSAGTDYTMTLKTDGKVAGFGQFGGQLGYDNFGVENYSPKVVPELNGVVRIDAGNTGTTALKSNGTVLAWGDYVGDGTRISRYNPITVPGLSGVVSVSTGGGQFSQFTVILKSDGSVMTWGQDSYYEQLGDGTSKNQYSPVAVYGGLNLGLSKIPLR